MVTRTLIKRWQPCQGVNNHQSNRRLSINRIKITQNNLGNIYLFQINLLLASQGVMSSCHLGIILSSSSFGVNSSHYLGNDISQQNISKDRVKLHQIITTTAKHIIRHQVFQLGSSPLSVSHHLHSFSNNRVSIIILKIK